MEESQEIKPDNQESNRNSDGTFKQGVSGNPAGRPKGQSLKEFWRQRLANMTEEEKLDFSKEIARDMVWRMGEGQPKTDVELSGEVKSKIIKLDE